MTRKYLALLLALATMGLSLAACAPTEPPIDTEAPTAASTDALTEAPTSAQTDAPTTETETEPAPVMNEEELAHMNAMLAESYEGYVLPIGGWSTPASVLRDSYSGEEGSYDKAFQLLADAGLTYMITLEEWSSGSWPLESLSSAKKAGLTLWYNCAGQAADYSIEKINALLSSPDADALATIYVKDEPTMGQIEETAATTAAIREALGETSTLPVMSNLLPTYASTDMISRDYRSYVRTYLDAAKPDRLMFDYYPYGQSGDTLSAMMLNIAIAREEAEKDGIELYTFIQSSGHGSLREPSVEDFRANVHLNLAMGVKGIAYFLTCEHFEGWEYTSMITAKGETTPLYDKVKAVNEELSGFKGVFLGFEHKGILISNYSGLKNQMERQGCTSALDSFGALREIETLRNSKAIIGCFEDEAGHEAYYVVNTEYTHRNTVTLTFDSTQSYVVWTKSGPTLVENTDTLELELESGDAAFVVRFEVYGE